MFQKGLYEIDQWGQCYETKNTVIYCHFRLNYRSNFCNIKVTLEWQKLLQYDSKLVQHDSKLLQHDNILLRHDSKLLQYESNLLQYESNLLQYFNPRKSRVEITAVN